jgi:hypothetical protein
MISAKQLRSEFKDTGPARRNTKDDPRGKATDTAPSTGPQVKLRATTCRAMAGVILWAPNKLPVLHNPIADPNQRTSPSCESGMTYPGPLKGRVDFNHNRGLVDKVGQVESHPRSLSYSFRLECVFSGRRDRPLFAVDQSIGNAASVLGSQRRHSRDFDRSQFVGESHHLASARRQDRVAYLAGDDAQHGQQQGPGRHGLDPDTTGCRGACMRFCRVFSTWVVPKGASLQPF